MEQQQQQHDDAAAVPTSKDHARSKYHHGRLPLFSNKTRGAHSCMVTVGHESRVCDAKGMGVPSRTSQAAYEATLPSPPGAPHARRKSNSVSSDGSGRSGSPHSPAPGDTMPRMHYEKPSHRMQSKKDRSSKEMSHHRDRSQRREDLVHGL